MSDKLLWLGFLIAMTGAGATLWNVSGPIEFYVNPPVSVGILKWFMFFSLVPLGLDIVRVTVRSSEVKSE